MGFLVEVTASENQLISGIPEYVDIQSSRTALYFYTLDGTDPNLDSLIAVDRIYLPTSGSSVTLKLIAYDEYDDDTGSDHYSDIITLNYYTNLDIKDSRVLINEGIDVYGYGEEKKNNLSVDSNGDSSRETSKNLEDLDIVTSEYDSKGLPNPDRSSYDFIRFPVLIKFSREKESDSLDNIYFNPKAKVIRIDGSTQDAYNSQVVRFINRGYNSIEPVKISSYENPLKKSNLITGNLVRYAYNPSTGIIVFYYFDSKDSRWVISTQKTDKKTFDFSKVGPSTRLGKYVFRWNLDPVFGKLR